MERTIAVKFDESVLPRWARNDPRVVALCRESLSFRCNVFDAKTPAAKRMLKKEVAQYEDFGNGLEFVGNTTEDSGYADARPKFYEVNKQ